MDMDRKTFSVASLHSADDDGYWLGKSLLERLEALEQLRIIMFGYDPTTARLQRTLTVTQLKKR